MSNSKQILESFKKRKRMPKLYNFHTFADPGCPIALSGPFRDNIQQFLQQCGEVEDYNIDGMPIWCTFLVHETKGLVIPLYTIEETAKNSFQPYCDQCRCTGWSHHFVTRRKYHMIIPVDDEWTKPLNDGTFDMHTHLLHGLIHCNGFGHLLCINGMEGGSKFLYGKEIMDLWDRICTNLHTRKITVEDVSVKRGMDLRLLHGIAYGRPWFGRWGYKFCQGSFGVTGEKYERAIELLSSLGLDQIIQDFCSSKLYSDVKRIIYYYRDTSESELVTIRDLFHFMLSLKSRGLPARRSPPNSVLSICSRSSARKIVQNKNVSKRKNGRCKNFTTLASNLDSRWPMKRMQYVAEVVVDALKEKKAANGGHNCGMSRQEVRDAARMRIGDTGLIDYMLKSMNNVIVGRYIVCRDVNPQTRVLEYTIEEVGHNVASVQVDQELDLVVLPQDQPQAIIPGIDVYSDIAYLYNNVLLEYQNSEWVDLAVERVIDSKQFVKEWLFIDEPDQLLRFICRVIPSLSDLETEFTRGYPSGEHIAVPLHLTLGELKEVVQHAMRDTYYIMERIVVTEICGLEGVEDGEVLFGTVESGTELCFRALGIDFDSELKYEGGADNWTVNCKCGTRDDDGEKMVACDICEVWQHTRCIGIDDYNTMPPLFVCDSCCAALAPPRTIQPSFEYDFESLEACYNY
ncbi:PHD domain-containing protein [Heracleum sosnowskyi]|uniref:PHD domain-containing protein n=1 Tax=Heracleum sosnowskyi TaxID=360622 RepID=A0AAD8H8N8_9APIA|nr:PHD domain-containing protein [Heracleum sosnowskyi]